MTFDDQEGLAVLKVNESFAEDEGVYTCQATNAWGRTASSANLTVVTGEILIQWFCFDHTHYVTTLFQFSVLALFSSSMSFQRQSIYLGAFLLSFFQQGFPSSLFVVF